MALLDLAETLADLFFADSWEAQVRAFASHRKPHTSGTQKPHTDAKATREANSIARHQANMAMLCPAPPRKKGLSTSERRALKRRAAAVSSRVLSKPPVEQV